MRHIEPKMVQYIDQKLAGNGLAQHAIEVKDARLLFTEAAKSCVGIREATNSNDGPMIELIEKTVGDFDYSAWCMSFVQTCLAYAEVKCDVKSWLLASEHCLTVWREAPTAARVKNRPAPGAIPIWQHGKTENGHTGVMLNLDGLLFSAVEGNTTSGQTADGKVVREGGGVYYTQRSLQGNGDMHVVGFLIPFQS